MKRLFTSLFASLLVLAMLTPMSAIAEELELPEAQTASNTEDIELAPDYSEIDLPFEGFLALDGLPELQTVPEASPEKGHTVREVPEAESEPDFTDQDGDSRNATRYGVPTALKLGVGETCAIKCTKSGKLAYKTSKKSVAKVSGKGVITGRKAGSATVTVYRNGKKLTTCKVKVVAAPKKVTLNKTKLSLKVKGTYRLTAKVNSGSHAKLTWTSSNKRVATVSSTGLVTAKKAGTATITVKTHNGKKATCKVSVKRPSSTLKASPASIVLYEGEEQDVTVTYTVNGTVRYSSSDEDVASCAWTSGWNGDDTTLTVYGNSAGSATVTITNDANSDTATIRVTVLAEEEEEDYGTLSVSPTTLSMVAGESRDVTVTYTVNGTVRFSSSDEDVASCAWTSGWYGDDTTLTVYGNSAGSATVTITNDANSDTATIHVTVAKASTPEPPEPVDEGGDSPVTYRALLIGEEDFPGETCSRNRGDVTLMQNMLSSVSGPAGGRYSVTCKYDLNLTGTMDAIRNTFSGADDDDVSLFFIASHGDSVATGSDAGAIALIGSSYDEQWLKIEDLASALNAVPGKVIVIIESCGSGAAIYDPGVSQNSGSSMRGEATSFDAAVISAFSRADPGIRVYVPRNSISKGAPSSNTGELRVENKFYVLTATRYQEDSYGTESYFGSYNYFTKWLTDGIGTSGPMPADSNNNGATTLSELFSYISSVGDDYPFELSDGTFYQHVQAYPKDSDYELFKR